MISAAETAGAPVAAALAGGAAGAFGAGARRTSTALVVNFAAGAFLSLALLHLIPEAVEHTGWLGALAAGAAGWVLCAGLAKWAGGFCPACDGDHLEIDHLRVGLPLLVMISVHSALDGLALAGPAEHSHEASLFSLALIVHKVPEGMATAAIIRAAGRSAVAALGLTALVQSFTFWGLGGGLALGGAGGALQGVGLGIVAGSFLYLAALTLVGDRRATRPAVHFVSAAAGALLIVAVYFAGGPGP